jgi:hypothetical protein
MKKLSKFLTALVLALSTLFAVPLPARAAQHSMVVDIDSIFVNVNTEVYFEVSYPGLVPASPPHSFMSADGSPAPYNSTGFNCQDLTHCGFEVHNFPITDEEIYFVAQSGPDIWVSQPISSALLNDLYPQPTVLVASSGFANPENIFANDGVFAEKIAQTASFTAGFEPIAYAGDGKVFGYMAFTPYFFAPDEVPQGVTCQPVLSTDEGDVPGIVQDNCGLAQGGGDNAAFSFTMPPGVQEIYSVTWTVTSPDGGDFPLFIDYIEAGFAGIFDMPPPQAPAINDLTGATLNAGDTYTESGSFSDSDSSSWAATVDYGDGSGVQALPLTGTSFELSHVYPDPGDYTVTVAVTDNQALTGTETATVTVNPGEQVVTFAASEDTFVRSGQKNSNAGDWQILRLQSSGNNRSLVRFDQAIMQDLIGSGTVLSATLRLTIVDNGDNWGASGRTIDAHRLLVNWAEGNDKETERGNGPGATWNCAVDSEIFNQVKNCSGSDEWEMDQPNNPSVHPWLATPSATQVISNGQSGTVDFDVTADVQAFMTGASSNFGWLLKKTNENQNGMVSFGSRENISPHLVVTFAP